MFCGSLTETHSGMETGRKDGSNLEGEEVRGGILRDEVRRNGSSTGAGREAG